MHTNLKYPAAMVTMVAGALFASNVPFPSAKYIHGPSPSVAVADDLASPTFGVTIPAGYRHWELVATSQETGKLDELRGILGNAIAMKAYREGTLPFPDGAILAKLAWKHVPSPEFTGAFVPGPATTLQIMVKDSKKYASTGGWGFGRFIDGKPVDEAQHKTCFPCHAGLVKEHDFVFTRYAP
jgi:cytochrome P460